MRVELQRIHKRFGPHHVLKGIDLTVDTGTIHGLVGENGAGKSTLMKILTGYLSRSGGRILLDGVETEFANPAVAARAGIGMLYQEPQDFPPLTVLDNFIVGRESQPGTGWKDPRRRLAQLADEVHFRLDPEAVLNKLTVGERQQLEFLRLLGREARLLILDEPTTGISETQKARLFQALRHIRDQGRTILLVSHKLEEVSALCDRVSILRHGQVMGEEDAPFHIPRLLELMFDAVPSTTPAYTPHTPGAELLCFRNVSSPGERTGLWDCDLSIACGEVIGLAGLAGSGQGLFLKLAAGLSHPSQGQIWFNGQQLQGMGYPQFKHLGGCYLPANRLEEGLISGFTILDHFALATNSSRSRARQLAMDAIRQFNIRGQPESPVESLSGGNQQRLLLSLIPTDARMVLLENPTRGLDVGSARWVWDYLRHQYAAGGVVVFSSAELDEILSVADRILVFFNGHVVRNLPVNQADYHDVAAAMTGS